MVNLIIGSLSLLCVTAMVIFPNKFHKDWYPWVLGINVLSVLLNGASIYGFFR